MKVADLSTGPDWLVWIFVIILAIISIVLISGHGGWLIAGYNMASKEEKAKYNEKKLCRTMGIGMSIITILLLIMELLENILPAFFIYVSLGNTLATSYLGEVAEFYLQGKRRSLELFPCQALYQFAGYMV